MRGIDMTNPDSMRELMEGGMFEMDKSPAQQAALERLEVTLALVEGWVDEVVGQATAERMPSATKLQEAVRRRRAAGGPAEDTFAALVGLELRPRRLRDASTLWGSLRTRQGTEARDGVWMNPRAAADRRRPRRPARVPRGGQRARGDVGGGLRRRASSGCWTARSRTDDGDDGHVGSDDADRGVSLRTPTRSRRCVAGSRRRPTRRHCGRATSRTSRRTPTASGGPASPTT